MNVYLEPQAWMSRGIKRVRDALSIYRPEGVMIVDSREKSDLEIIHTVGWGSLPENFGDRRYAIIQYCAKTTEDPDPQRWLLEVWSGADVVWSYYQLDEYVKHLARADDLNLYHAPLGVDGSIFRPIGEGRRSFKIGTSGYIAETESVGECARAADKISGATAHLGPDLGLPGRISYNEGLSDDGVARLWSSCERVAALRRVEGFELPAIEGLACGARPVAFDAPHYTRWFGEHADYVPEVSADDLVPLLAELFAKPPRPVSEAERKAVLERFDWKMLAQGFWERVL